jgi:Regulator of chromosome condensation (RCC1) repeat
VVGIAAGGSHSLALTSNGKIVGWGQDKYGECEVPPALASQTATAIDGGYNSTLALTSNGKVFAWGNDIYGQSTVPASLNSQTVTGISAGGFHSLAVTSNGKVTAWGNNDYGQCNVPASLSTKTVVAVSGGAFHSLALTSTGQVVAWGANWVGQCNVPASLTGKTVVAISAGESHNLALTSEGKVVAWGDNFKGQCDPPSYLDPMPVAAVSAGGLHSLALVLRDPPYFESNEPTGTFTGGKAASVMGLLTLGKPTDHDLTVYLSSSDPAVGVDPSVTIPSGADTAPFLVTSSPVATYTDVTITAKILGYRDAKLHFVLKPQLVQITVNPASFEGGTTGSGKVSLWVTSATDTWVSLESHDPHVIFDGGGTVVIPRNQLSANFDILSTVVTEDTEADFVATPGISTLTSLQTVTLLPVPTIASFVTSKSTVYGNQKLTFRLTLNRRPGPNGTTVSLRTGGAGLVGVPTSLFFPAGVTSKSFDVYAAENASDGSVLVTATSGTSAIGKTIAVKRLKVSGSSLSTSSIKGGNSVNVSVNLNAPVDVDTVITVASSDPSVASVPTTVKVPAGSNTVTYSLTTYAVTTRKSITITATKGGVTTTKTLVVTK